MQFSVPLPAVPQLPVLLLCLCPRHHSLTIPSPWRLAALARAPHPPPTPPTHPPSLARSHDLDRGRPVAAHCRPAPGATPLQGGRCQALLRLLRLGGGPQPHTAGGSGRPGPHRLGGARGAPAGEAGSVAQPGSARDAMLCCLYQQRCSASRAAPCLHPASAQVPTPEAAARGAFTVVCEWGKTASSLETLLEEEMALDDDLPGQQGSWAPSLSPLLPDARRACMLHTLDTASCPYCRATTQYARIHRTYARMTPT